MRIFSFNLILAMDFLNKIAEFMTTGLAQTAEHAPKEEGVPKITTYDRSAEALAVSLTYNSLLKRISFILRLFQI